MDLSPWLTEELTVHKQRARFVSPSDFVFATRNGTRRNRSNITRQILQPAIERANATLAETGLGAIEA